MDGAFTSLAGSMVFVIIAAIAITFGAVTKVVFAGCCFDYLSTLPHSLASLFSSAYHSVFSLSIETVP